MQPGLGSRRSRATCPANVPAVNVVDRYLSAVAGQDWAVAQDCLAEDIRRVGPFGDVYEGRESYIEFLRQLMPTLAGYRMDIQRILTADRGRTVVAELSETVEDNGNPRETHESLVFDIDDASHISHISIYIQRTD